MRIVYTVKLREELAKKKLGAFFTDLGKESLGTLSDKEIDGAEVLATSDETGAVVLKLKDNRKVIVNAIDIDFFKDGIQQEVKK